jgi:hypothetical protein
MRFVLALVVVGIAASASAQPCRVTAPPNPAFVPPAPYPEAAPEGNFWYGTEHLWTMIRRDSMRARRDKFFFWRPGYNGAVEPRPNLQVIARSLDSGVAIVAPIATNASHPSFGGWAMLTMIDFPSPGCWDVSATYGGYTIRFVTGVN